MILRRGGYPERRSSLMPLVALPAVLLVVVAIVVLSMDGWPGAAPGPRPVLARRGAGPDQRVSAHERPRPRFPAGAARVGPGPGPLGLGRRAATALWSFDWRHPAGAASPLLRPLVTGGLWSELAASPGAPAATAAALREQETARVVSVTVTVADRSPAAVGVAVSAVVVVGAEGRPGTRGREDAELLVKPTPSGWRIARIDE